MNDDQFQPDRFKIDDFVRWLVWLTGDRRGERLLIWIGPHSRYLFVDSQLHGSYDDDQFEAGLPQEADTRTLPQVADLIIDHPVDVVHKLTDTSVRSAHQSQDNQRLNADQANPEDEHHRSARHWLKVQLLSFLYSCRTCMSLGGRQKNTSGDQRADKLDKVAWWRERGDSHQGGRTISGAAVNALLNQLSMLNERHNIEVQRVFSVADMLIDYQPTSWSTVIVISFSCETQASFVRASAFRRRRLLYTTNLALEPDHQTPPPEGQASIELEDLVIQCVRQLQKILDTQRIYPEKIYRLALARITVDWQRVSVQTGLAVEEIHPPHSPSIDLNSPQRTIGGPHDRHRAPPTPRSTIDPLILSSIHWVLKRRWHKGHFFNRRLVRRQRCTAQALLLSVLSMFGALVALSLAVAASWSSSLTASASPAVHSPRLEQLLPREHPAQDQNIQTARWVQERLDTMPSPVDLLLAASGWLQDKNHWRLDAFHWQKLTEPSVGSEADSSPTPTVRARLLLAMEPATTDEDLPPAGRPTDANDDSLADAAQAIKTGEVSRSLDGPSMRGAGQRWWRTEQTQFSLRPLYPQVTENGGVLDELDQRGQQRRYLLELTR